MLITDQEKQRLAMTAIWPVDIAAEYFDILPDHVRDLMESPGAAEVNRFELEKRLARDGLIGLDGLAREFGVPREALERAMRNPPKMPFTLAPFLPDSGSGERFLLRQTAAEAWVKALLPKNKIWRSLDGRAYDLAKSLDSGVRECAVSKRFGDSPPAVATCRCIVTWDDVSRAHQEYLENGKHLSLEPDHVGWHAIVDKKVSLSNLWSPDTTNIQRYLEEHGQTWRAA